MVTATEPKRAADIEDIIVAPQPEAEYEFLIHHMGQRFWVDCWLLHHAGRVSKTRYIKIPWVIKILGGENKGKLRVSNVTYKYRWLHSDDDLARLRKKE